MAETHPRLAVARLDGQFGLMAAEPIHPTDTILVIDGVPRDHPTRFSVQVDDDLHLEPPGEPDPAAALDRHIFRFLNHSCTPNARVRGCEVIAIQAISAWEEITFDYNTTEYDIAFPFPCRCRCGGALVRGFKHLSAAERIRLRPLLADHLRRRLDEGDARAE